MSLVDRLPSPSPRIDTVFPAREPMPRRYFIRVDHWWILIGLSASVALSLVSLYENDSRWIGVGIFAATLVLLHTFLIARTIPWIPGLIALVSFVQWVIAPWANYYILPDATIFTMVLRPSEYFPYAVPAATLFALGMYVPLWGFGRTRVERRPVAETIDFRRTCDVMIVLSTGAFFMIDRVGINIRFLFTLLTYLGYVGAFGLMLVNERGWTWRVLFVLSLSVALSTADGLFHELLLWVVYGVALFAFTKRLRPIVLVGFLVGGAFFIGVLDEAKIVYRTQIRIEPNMKLSDRFVVLGREVVTQAQQPVETFTGDALSHFVTRLNQGWIIARTMFWVPASEPFAKGETLVNAFRAAIVPRILDPGKYEAGGTVYFQRFTGYTLYHDTSMNLSVAGEMYANFGFAGGLIGVFLFGVGIGYVYRYFALLASQSPLWWAWAPYVLLYAMQAENGIGEGANHVAKSFLVMWAVTHAVPAWRQLPRLARRRALPAP